MPRSEQLIRTKFFIPRITGNHVLRESLIRKLNAVPEFNFTLVSAPAGYGKSTLVSSWIKQQSIPATWLSLDANDNELFGFIRYIVGALQVYEGSFGTELIQILNSSAPPSNSQIISKLINDLAGLEGPVILVLDDFHFISDAEILEIIENLVRHPLPGFHPVIITRSDPNLPMHKMRLSGNLLEVRARDMFLNHSEAFLLLTQRFGQEPTEGLVNAVLEFTEGWISGLKIMIMAVEDYAELKNLLENQSPTDLFQVKYHLESYLSSLQSKTRRYVIAASIFKEFNLDLCFFVNSDIGPLENVDTEDDFIEKLSSDGMFIIPLDASSKWFRYHHYFRDLLFEELTRELSENEIRSIHSRASHWFETNGLHERSIRHAIQGKNEDRALELFTKYRLSLLSSRNWREHEVILDLFSQNCRDISPVMLISRAWVNIYHGKMSEAFELITSNSELIQGETRKSPDKLNLLGELNTIKSYASYYQGNANETIVQSQMALDQLDPENVYPRGLAWIFHGGAFQMQGRGEDIMQVLQEGYSNTRHDYIRSSILHVICYIHWLNANITDLKISALQLIDLGTKSNTFESETYGHIFLGHHYYQTGQIQFAREQYQQAYEKGYHILGSVRAQATIGLIMSLFHLAKVERAHEILDELEINLSETGNEFMIKLVALARAELEFRSGMLEKAFQLTQHIGNVPLRPTTDYFAPELSLSKIWIYYGTVTCEGQVNDLLNKMENRLKKINNRRFLIDVYALKAIYHFEKDLVDDAFIYLKKAIKLARPGGCVMVFADMGEKMMAVLEASPLSAANDAFVEQILLILRNAQLNKTFSELSKREHEILLYLADKLSNKEIGAKLFIAEKTVKNHLNNIYRKLGASDRKEAVLKARESMMI
jgi:LuxR family maltose regulon positive regulatory protein